MYHHLLLFLLTTPLSKFIAISLLIAITLQDHCTALTNPSLNNHSQCHFFVKMFRGGGGQPSGGGGSFTCALSCYEDLGTPKDCWLCSPYYDTDVQRNIIAWHHEKYITRTVCTVFEKEKKEKKKRRKPQIG